MRRLHRVTLAVLGAALVSAACEIQSCNNITNPPDPTPSPSASPLAANPGCPPAYSVGVSVEGHPNPLVVGSEYVLDVTPKGPDGKPLDPICHGRVVVWTITGPCAISANGGFNPRLRCSAPGTLTAQACVSAPGGCGSVTLPVTA